jgi:hypothetical protein
MIRQAKPIDLPNLSLILVLELQTLADGSIDIRLQLYPSPEEPTLPPGLELILLGDRQNPLLSALSRSQDRGLQLQFSAESPETFEIQLNYHQHTWKQTFQT